MREIFFAFRSRSEAMKFYEQILNYGIAGQIINTPKEAGIGCGLSVKMMTRELERAKNILARGRFVTYLGAFAISFGGKISKMV